jgi:hypothetical protein
VTLLRLMTGRFATFQMSTHIIFHKRADFHMLLPRRTSKQTVVMAVVRADSDIGVSDKAADEQSFIHAVAHSRNLP